MYERRIEKLGKIEVYALLNVVPFNARSVLRMRQLSSAAYVN